MAVVGAGCSGKALAVTEPSPNALQHSDVWAAAACHSGEMGFELCYLPDMPATLRALAGSNNSIEKWWRGVEEAKKRPDGIFTALNVLGMAASYDPDPSEFLGMRLPVMFDTCDTFPGHSGMRRYLLRWLALHPDVNRST